MDFWQIVLAAASQGGGGVVPVVLGNELVTNGTFDDDTGWLLSGTAGAPTISGGTLNGSDNGFNCAKIQAAEPLIAGTYRATFTVSNRNAGSVTIFIGTDATDATFAGGTAGTARSANGTYTQDIVVASVSGDYIAIRIGNGSLAKADDVSVKRIVG